MSGPARAGLSIYANEMNRLISFYEAVCGMSVIHTSRDVSVLQSSDIQLIVLRMPDDRANDIVIEDPPKLRDAALKFFFTVPSIDAARSVAEDKGGGVGAEQWQGPGFIVRNAYDPEGNVFHLRQRLE